ncbi:M48 family metalloprotease [Bradyrhizobium sp.]|uniref:M48 family metalloprotease n=1 Tax=Bradyrhizobium sp. TaxID=376 RepID=UPI0040381B54
MIDLLPATIAGLAVSAVAIEFWIARRAVAWLGRRTTGAVLARETGRVRQFAWRGAASSLLALAAALGGAAALARLSGPLLLPIAAVLPALLDIPVAARARGREPDWRSFFQERWRLLYSEARLSVPIAALAGLAMPEAGWWLVAWAGFASALILRELVPPSGRTLSAIAPGPLATEIAAMLRKSRLEGTEVRVANESRRSNQMNARAQGIVAGRCIVLDDTLVAGLTTGQALAVAAHEAGHLAGRHREWFIAWRLIAALGAAFAAALLGGGDAPQESAAMLLLALPALGLFVRPLETRLIRRWESAADRHAASLAGTKIYASALTRLFGANLAAPEPEPVWASFHHPHPPPALRLARLTAAAP